MKFSILYIIFLNLITLEAWGQNLVPNPSFEDWTTCGIFDTIENKGSSIERYTRGEILVINNWTRMASNGDLWGPVSLLCPLYSLTGYDGFHNYPYKFFCKGEKNSFFEDVFNLGIPQPLSGKVMMYVRLEGKFLHRFTSIITNLPKPLLKDSIYKLEFYVRSTPYTYYTTDNFGWYFSPVKVDTQEWSMRIPDLRSPQYILYQSPPGKRLDEIEDWIKISSCYKAKGDEKSLYFSVNIPYNDSYLVSKYYDEFDNFNEALKKIQEIAPLWMRPGNPADGDYIELYCFIDSVSLVKIPYHPIIRDTVMYCMEDIEWALDSTDLSRKHILCSYGL